MKSQIQKCLLGTENNIFKDAALWNMASGMINAAQSAIILIFISRKLNITDAGIFTIAYAVANLVSTIGRYGVRNYQVTDQEADKHFENYLAARYITMAVTVFGLFIYLFWMHSESGYSLYKVFIILELSALKLIDALEDVFLGLYQQKGRLDVGSKILTLRLILTTIIICGFIGFGYSMQIAIAAGVISSVIIDLFLLWLTFPYFQISIKCSFNRKILFSLLKACLPLCIGMSLSVYIGNAPKYVIDAYMNEEVQAIFGFLMMPVFVIMLLNNFIYQPIIKKLGDLWNQKKYKEFTRKVMLQYGIVGILTIVIVAAGAWLGIPILSFIYHIELSNYKTEFIVLLAGGGLYALVSFLSVPITVIRYQKSIALGYLITTAAVYLSGRYFIVTFGMMGAAVLYLLINAILVAFFSIVLAVGIRRHIGVEPVRSVGSVR